MGELSENVNVVDESTLPAKTVVMDLENESSQQEDIVVEESREDETQQEDVKQEDNCEERETNSDQRKKPPSPTRSTKSTSNNENKKKQTSGARPYNNNNSSNNPFMNARLPFHMGHVRGAPFGAPPPYGYHGSGFGHPPHYPPHPHMMPPGPYGAGPGSYPGPHRGMKGGFGPPPMYGGPPGPYGMHPYPGPRHGMPPNFHIHPNITASDSASISSKGSLNSKKKRTIDGMSGNSSVNQSMPNAYAIRRMDSNSSSTSTVTAGNNTSSETHLNDDNNANNKSSALSFDTFGSSRPENLHNDPPRRYHRRDYSGTSTASSLSVGGFSLASYERAGDVMMTDAMKSSPTKRHKKNERNLVVDTEMRPPSELMHPLDDAEHSSRFEQLSIGHKPPTSTESNSSSGSNLFLSLSTSPINAADVDATPISKNTTKKEEEMKEQLNKRSIFKPKPILNKDRPSDTPTPPVHGELGDSEMNDDHSMLHRHLRGQSFTPLPHISNGDFNSSSPSNTAFASAIAPQLSWSIAGETPSLGDLAEWEEEHGKLKTEQKSRPTSTTSVNTRDMMISPHDFQLWKEEHDLVDHATSGTTTPLPVFFDQSGNEGAENQRFECNKQHMHTMYPRHSNKSEHPHHHPFWPKHEVSGMVMPPTPMFHEEPFPGHSPMHGDRRDGMIFHYAHPGHHPSSDRIRNLRGRVPGGAHLPPMPLHIPPHMSAHLPMTSPMGLGPKGGLWSPHHGGMGPPMGSPHHLGSPLSNMAQSKRKCIPLKPPIPSKFQGDMEKTKSAPVPEFTSLVNFPSHMSQKQSVNLPEGMRCCVMCGQACPCSTGNKGKKSKGGKSEGGLAPRNSNGQDHMSEKSSGYAIIPTQNKGLCTLCDVNVWVVAATGLEIKWCKGCKNFRPWASFGDKGLATKCLRCRERQREKYAMQKEEKEKTRVVTKAKK